MSSSNMENKLYMHPIGYFHPAREGSLCIPGCNICCYVGGSGIGLTVSDLIKNRQHNKASSSGIELKVSYLGGRSMENRWTNGSEYVAEIPAIEINERESADLANLLRLLSGNKPTKKCVHSSSADSSKMQQLLVSYNSVLRLYGFELKEEDMEGINAESFGFCEAYQTPRSSQCRLGCSYSAKHLPRLLRELGKGFFLELLRAETLEERFILINKKLRELHSGKISKK